MAQGTIMHKTLAWLAILSAIPVAVASAADMPVKAPLMPLAPAAAADWTGLYLDVDGGWQKESYNWFYPAPGLGFPAFHLSSSGGVLGGHVGYQQQFNWLVVGVEAGISAPTNGRAAISSPTAVAFTPPCGFAVGTTCQVNAGDVSTLGGKLGVAWQDWLVYGVGGVARGAVGNTQTILASGAVDDSTNGQNHTGWYAGAGLDFMTVKTQLVDLILGVEYEHIDLGTVQECQQFGGATFCFPAVSGERNIGTKEDIVWGKLTLKFNLFGH